PTPSVPTHRHVHGVGINRIKLCGCDVALWQCAIRRPAVGAERVVDDVPTTDTRGDATVEGESAGDHVAISAEADVDAAAPDADGGRNIVGFSRWRRAQIESDGEWDIVEHALVCRRSGGDSARIGVGVGRLLDLRASFD